MEPRHNRQTERQTNKRQSKQHLCQKWWRQWVPLLAVKSVVSVAQTDRTALLCPTAVWQWTNGQLPWTGGIAVSSAPAAALITPLSHHNKLVKISNYCYNLSLSHPI